MINYTGLHKRPTLEGIVDYLANGQESVKYPNRLAKQLRNHPYLTQFDAEGIFEVEELDRKMREQEIKEKTIRDMATQANVSAQLARASAPAPALRFRTSGQLRRSVGDQPASSSSESERPSPGRIEREREYSEVMEASAVPVPGFDERDLVEASEAWRSHVERQEQIAYDRRSRLTQAVERQLSQYQPSGGVIPFISNVAQGIVSAVKGRIVPKEEEEEEEEEEEPEIKQEQASSSSAAAADLPPRPTIAQLYSQASKLINNGQWNREVTKKYHNLRDQYNDASRIKDIQRQNELKAELCMLITGRAIAPAVPRVKKAQTSEDVELTGVTINRSKNVDYWMQQSANELRAQLVLRGWKRADAGVKDLKQLQQIVKDLIANGKW